MKQILRPFIMVTALAMLSASANAQEKTIKTVPAKPTTAIDGKSLFQEYCAVCHGPNGKGGGPAASALKAAPGDLTQISRKNGGKFPEERLLRILKGEETLAAHGNQDMPIWGQVFNNMGNLNMTQGRLNSLLQYIEGMQAK